MNIIILLGCLYTGILSFVFLNRVKKDSRNVSIIMGLIIFVLTEAFTRV